MKLTKIKLQNILMGNHIAIARSLADLGQPRQGKCKCFEGRAFPWHVPQLPTEHPEQQMP